MSETSAEGLSITADSYTRQAYEAFERAAELCSAVRYLFWFKETGDSLRNRHKYTPEQLAQRKALLNLAHGVLKAERDEQLERFFGCLDYRDNVALKELQERLDGGFK